MSATHYGLLLLLLSMPKLAAEIGWPYLDRLATHLDLVRRASDGLDSVLDPAKAPAESRIGPLVLRLCSTHTTALRHHLVRVRSAFRVDNPLTKSGKTLPDMFLALPCLVDQEGSQTIEYRPSPGNSAAQLCDFPSRPQGQCFPWEHKASTVSPEHRKRRHRRFPKRK